MASSITVQKTGEKKVKQLIKAMPGFTKRGRASASSSTAFFAQNEIKKHIVAGGVFPSLHPLTAALRPSGKKWRKRAKSQKAVPFFRFRRNVGYHKAKDGSIVTVGMGLGPRRTNISLRKILKEHESGEPRHITSELQRKRISSGLIRAGLKPLRKSTKTLKIPARKIVDPVARRLKSIIPRVYRDRFDRAIIRYTENKANKTSSIGI